MKYKAIERHFKGSWKSDIEEKDEQKDNKEDESNDKKDNNVGKEANGEV